LQRVGAEIVPTEVVPPVVVGIQLVHQQRAMGAAVSGKVALPVTVDVERPHPLRAMNRLLPHTGVHGPPAP